MSWSLCGIRTSRFSCACYRTTLLQRNWICIQVGLRSTTTNRLFTISCVLWWHNLTCVLEDAHNLGATGLESRWRHEGLSDYTWSKVSAAVKMNSSVFLVITRREVVWYRRFGTTYLLPSLSLFKHALLIPGLRLGQLGPVCSPAMSVLNHRVTTQKTEKTDCRNVCAVWWVGRMTADPDLMGSQLGLHGTAYWKGSSVDRYAVMQLWAGSTFSWTPCIQ